MSDDNKSTEEMKAAVLRVHPDAYESDEDGERGAIFTPDWEHMIPSKVTLGGDWDEAYSRLPAPTAEVAQPQDDITCANCGSYIVQTKQLCQHGGFCETKQEAKPQDAPTCGQCAGTGEVCYSSTSYGPCPDCSKKNAAPAQEAVEEPWKYLYGQACMSDHLSLHGATVKHVIDDLREALTRARKAEEERDDLLRRAHPEESVSFEDWWKDVFGEVRGSMQERVKSTAYHAWTAAKNQQSAQHTKWVMNQAVKLFEVGVTFSDGGACINNRAEAAEARVAELEAQVEGVRSWQTDAANVLGEIIDDEPCRLDHHGCCQNHGSSESPCYMPRARALVASPRPTQEEEQKP